MSMNFSHLRANVASQVMPEVRSATLEGVRAVLTEANTDILIERMVKAIKAQLPAYLRWIPIGTVLDALFPGVLLKMFEDALS